MSEPSIGDIMQDLKKANERIAKATDLFKDIEPWITPLPGFEYAKIDRETSNELIDKLKEGGWII
jgi:hypothetical protein